MTSHTRALVAGAMLALAAASPAQSSVVWPPGYGSRPGESAQAAPFSISDAHPNGTSFAVTTLTADSLAFGSGSVIQRIAFRRDTVNREGYSGYRGFLRVNLGSLPDAENPTSSLPSLFSLGYRSVFKGTIDVPSSSPPPSGSHAPFNLEIPLWHAWTYPGGDFGVELAMAGPSDVVWRRDAAHVDDGVPATFLSVGSGCVGSNGHVPHSYLDLDAAIPGETIDVRLTFAPLPQGGGNRGEAIHLLGTRLDPLALHPVGFPPGCKLLVDPIRFTPRTTGDRSTQDFVRARYTLSVPANPTLSGVALYSQWAAHDAGHNVPIPLLMSNGIRFVIGTRSSTSHIHWGRSLWGYGGNAVDRGRGLELGPPNYVPVIRFTGNLTQR